MEDIKIKVHNRGNGHHDVYVGYDTFDNIVLAVAVVFFIIVAITICNTLGLGDEPYKSKTTHSTTAEEAFAEVTPHDQSFPEMDSTFPCRYSRELNDRFGNHYENAILYRYGDETHHDTYYLNGEYSTFSGIVFVPTDRKNSTYKWNQVPDMYYVNVYGDGELLWTSPKLVDDIAPCHFTLNVTDVNNLEVYYYGGASTWAMPFAMANIAFT